ncbi:MAG: TonB-dependent receptor, partial [Gammaproteobacteria bacterium]|nr:TonB-dependent receptor [Gammaproteobacteria bacterium]
VVSARKVQESAQDIPISISAFSGAALETRQVVDVRGLDDITPNLEITSGASGPLGSNFTIRGQSNQDFTILSDLAVGIYLDGVVNPRAQAVSLGLFDVSRVEVLKGPQGTLYGRNTSGGAISVFSNEPEMNEFSGNAAVSLGNYGLVSGTGVINTPLIEDTLAARFAVKKTDRDGFSDVTDGNGITTDQDDVDVTSFKGSLLWTPSDATKVKLAVDYSEFAQTSAPARIVNLVPLLEGGPLAGIAFFSGLSESDLVPSDFRDANANNGLPGQNGLNNDGISGIYGEGEIWGASLTAEHEFDNFTLRSVTGYRDSDLKSSSDLDGSVLTVIHTNLNTASDSFSQEFNLLGSAYNGQLDWIAGLYYFKEDGQELAISQFFTGPNDFDAPFDGISLIPGALQVATNKSEAIFAQGTWSFNDQWSATVGVRYTEDQRDLTRFIPRTTLNFDQSVVFVDEPTLDLDNTSYTAGIDYKVNEDVLLYLKTSTGYRSGGHDNRTPGNFFDEETVEDFELGMKGDFLEGRLRINAALFQTDYQDQQLSSIFATAAGPTTIVTNVGESTIKGGELDVTIAATDNLTIFLSGGWLDAEFDEFIDPLTGADNSDEPFPFVADLTYNIGASYIQTLSDGDINYYFNYGWRDEINYENGIRDLEPSRGLLDARISYTPASERYEFSIWGANLNDEEYNDSQLAFQTGLVPFGYTLGFAGAPRTYGVEVKVNF